MKAERTRHCTFSFCRFLNSRHAFGAITFIAVGITGILASANYFDRIRIRYSEPTAVARIVSIESTQVSRIDSVDKEETIEPVLAQSLPTEPRDAEPPSSVQAIDRSAALEHDVSQEGAIQLVGIAIETSFQNDQYVQDLEKLWRQYAESETLFSIPETVDNKTYVAYSNYSEDGNRLTLSIGHRVASFEAIPEGLSQIRVPATKFAQFNVTGNLEEAIPNTWEAIELLSLQRAYSTDLEVYDYQNENMAEIWASVN